MQLSYNYQISQVLLKHSFQLQPDVSREKCAILLKSTFGTLRVNQCATHQTKEQINKSVVKEEGKFWLLIPTLDVKIHIISEKLCNINKSSLTYLCYFFPNFFEHGIFHLPSPIYLA